MRMTTRNQIEDNDIWSRIQNTLPKVHFEDYVTTDDWVLTADICDTDRIIAGSEIEEDNQVEDRMKAMTTCMSFRCNVTYVHCNLFSVIQIISMRFSPSELHKTTMSTKVSEPHLVISVFSFSRFLPEQLLCVSFSVRFVTGWPMKLLFL